MAYTPINKSTDHFTPKLFTGNGGTNAITGVGFQPDFTWIKNRSRVEDHVLYDSLRGATKRINSNTTNAEDTKSNGLTAFGTDGFTVDSAGQSNYNGDNIVSFNWKAGGTAPTKTYTVKVVSDSGNKYRFDDFGTSAVTLDLQEGGTYTFDQSDSSNSGHPFRFGTSGGNASDYTTGVTTTGTPGQSGAKTVITVAAGAPNIYYNCSVHSGMGGAVNTNTTFGSSNFSGTTQSLVSVNATAGFSIVRYTGTGSTATIGHGLSSEPHMVFVKSVAGLADHWFIYHKGNGNTGSQYLNLNNGFTSGSNDWNNTTPSSTTFTVGTQTGTNGNTHTFLAYCFAPKTGFSKFGTYVPNNDTDNAFIYTGFKPDFLMIKRSGSTGDWHMYDSFRQPINSANGTRIRAQRDIAEETDANSLIDMYSNGFKIRTNSISLGNHTDKVIYMAFGQSIVGGDTTQNIPATAR